MPHKTWVHGCKENGARVWLGEEICRSCGEIGTPDGYGLTGIEAMGNFNRLTGLPTIGPHRKTLPEFTEICPACNGEGVVVIEQWDRWFSCRSCGGTGEIVTVPQKKFIEIQKAAWKIFDDWRLENADAGKRADIIEIQRNRQYKTIYTQDHYAPKRTKREIRYFAKMDRLMYEELDDAVSDSELAPQVVKETKAPMSGVFFWILIILMLVKVILN